MDQSEFGQFVAALWERQGWQTQVKRDDGRVFVAVQRPQTGEEGLIWAIPDEGEVGGKQVQQFSSVCDEYGVEEGAIVTAGALSDHAEKVAEGIGVELLDGEGIERVLKRKELTDLASQYGGSDGDEADGDGGGQGNGSADSDGSPLDQLRATAARASTLISGAVDDAGVPIPTSVSGTTVIIVVVVALLGTGVLLGPSLSLLGGDGGPISAASASPDDSTTTLHVEWNAKVVDEIDPNESDEQAYYPPAGEQFVVVRMSINNTGDRQAELTQAAFELRTDERTHSYRALADHDGFLDFPIAPGQHYVGWTVFTVPEGTTGTLVYDQNATAASIAVEFEYDSDLPVEVTQR
jgi:hypothetical protein